MDERKLVEMKELSDFVEHSSDELRHTAFLCVVDAVNHNSRVNLDGGVRFSCVSHVPFGVELLSPLQKDDVATETASRQLGLLCARMLMGSDKKISLRCAQDWINAKQTMSFHPEMVKFVDRLVLGAPLASFGDLEVPCSHAFARGMPQKALEHRSDSPSSPPLSRSTSKYLWIFMAILLTPLIGGIIFSVVTSQRRSPLQQHQQGRADIEMKQRLEAERYRLTMLEAQLRNEQKDWHNELRVKLLELEQSKQREAASHLEWRRRFHLLEEELQRKGMEAAHLQEELAIARDQIETLKVNINVRLSDHQACSNELRRANEALASLETVHSLQLEMERQQHEQQLHQVHQQLQKKNHHRNHHHHRHHGSR